MLIRLLSRQLVLAARMLIWVTVVSAFTLRLAEAAPDQPGKNRLNLKTAIEKTLAQHPSLKIFDYRVKSLEGALKSAALTPEKTISLEAENILGSGDMRLLKSTELSLALSSVIELGGKRDKRRASVQQKFKQVELDKKAQALNLIAAVSRRFVEAVAAQEALKLARQNLTLAQTRVKKVNNRYQAGASPQAEVYRAKADLARARLALKQKQQQADQQKVLLSLFWQSNQAGSAKPYFSELTGNLFEFGQAKNFNQLLNQLSNNPEILALIARQQQQNADLALIEAQSSADVGWSLGVKYDNGPQDLGFVAGLSLPLNQAGRNQGQIKSALATRNQTLVAQATLRQQLHARLYQTYQAREFHLLSLTDLDEQILPLLNTALIQTRTAYQAGRYDYSEWISARQALIDAQQARIRHAKQILLHNIELERLTGTRVFSPNSQGAE